MNPSVVIKGRVGQQPTDIQMNPASGRSLAGGFFGVDGSRRFRASQMIQPPQTSTTDTSHGRKLGPTRRSPQRTEW